jgi:hypothetical protein
MALQHKVCLSITALFTDIDNLKKQVYSYEIWGFHGGEYVDCEDGCPLGYSAV